MPFKKSYEPILKMIKEAAELVNADPVQMNEQYYAGSITTRICNEIDAAEVLIAIASEENGNVYYEIGLAHCQRKPVVILTSDPSALKFDLRDHRALVYDPKNPARCRDELVKTLSVLLNMAGDPKEHLASAFRGTSNDHETAYQVGLKKAVATVVDQLGLSEPIHITEVHFHQAERGVSFEIKDFLGGRVRALVDVNGIVRSMKRISR